MVEAKQKTAAEMLKSAYGLSSDARPALPTELASAFNLMAHPLAGVAAMSAIGFGFASHALGIWAGALSGAAAASQRLAPKMLDRLTPNLDDANPAKTVPLVRARLAVVTSLADARAAADKASRAEAATAPMRAVAAPVLAEVIAPAIVAPAVPVTEAPAVAVIAPPVVAEIEAPAVARTAKPAVAKVKPAAPKTKAVAKAKPAVATPVAKTPSTAQPASIARPAAVDDLKAISGIGPKLEQVLNGLGIWTYAQIAGWSPAEIAWVDDRLGFSGRIVRDDWIGQAVALGGKAKA